MSSRTFLNVSLGIVALALAYHLGASSATAQSAGNPIVAAAPASSVGPLFVFTANGDTYQWNGAGWDRYTGVFGGMPTPVQQQSLGSVKVRYR